MNRVSLGSNRAALAALLVMAACSSEGDRKAVTVGSDGGTVAEGGAEVTIPPGALGDDTEIGVGEGDAPPTAEPPADQDLSSGVYELTPHGQVFSVPVTVTMPFEGAADGARLMKLDGPDDTTWDPVPDATFANGIATFQTTSFSFYAVYRESAAGSPDAGPESPDAAPETPDAAPSWSTASGMGFVSYDATQTASYAFLLDTTIALPTTRRFRLTWEARDGQDNLVDISSLTVGLSSSSEVGNKGPDFHYLTGMLEIDTFAISPAASSGVIEVDIPSDVGGRTEIATINANAGSFTVPAFTLEITD